MTTLLPHSIVARLHEAHLLSVRHGDFGKVPGPRPVRTPKAQGRGQCHSATGFYPPYVFVHSKGARAGVVRLIQIQNTIRLNQHRVPQSPCKNACFSSPILKNQAQHTHIQTSHLALCLWKPHNECPESFKASDAYQAVMRSQGICAWCTVLLHTPPGVWDRLILTTPIKAFISNGAMSSRFHQPPDRFVSASIWE